MSMQAEGVHERLRSIVGPKWWGYAAFWQLDEETRTLDWIGCCCSGVTGATGNDSLVASTRNGYLAASSTCCPDVTDYHPASPICSILASLPSSISLDSGIQGRVFLGGQPEWVQKDPSVEGQEMSVLTKVCIPVQSGLVELGVTNYAVKENAALVRYVRDRCEESWEVEGMSKRRKKGKRILDASGGQESMMDQEAVKVNYSRNSPPILDISWPPSSHPWEHEDPMLESQLLMGNVDNQELMNQLPGSTTHHPHQALTGTIADPPPGSALSKDDGEAKQELRRETTDCADPKDDDDEKGVPRSSRSHPSKNLVTERKRRKTLTERLYSVRDLFPKITKMKRASTLGDAIDFVKEVEQHAKELQEELLLDCTEKHVQVLVNLNYVAGTADHQVANLGGAANNEGQCGRVNMFDSQFATAEVIDRQGDQELSAQPMQVEVTKMDGRFFSLRILREERPGVFVKLMQALDALGLHVVRTSNTTFSGLVLNIFTAEMRDKELLLMGAEQVREALLEMVSQFSHGPLTGTTSDCPANLQPTPVSGEITAPKYVTEGPPP